MINTEYDKKGVRYYNKVMTYTAKKWNLSTNEPTDSSDTKHDVIEFVRWLMYLELHATNTLDYTSVGGKDDDSDDNIINNNGNVNNVSTKIKHTYV